MACAILFAEPLLLTSGKPEGFMGKAVQSVLGPISTEKIGATLIHEHVVTCCDWSMRMAFGSLYYEDDAVMPLAIQKLREAKKSGIDTIVDGTPVNLGRDIRNIVRAAEESGVNVIASSGFFHQEDPFVSYKPEEELKELLMRDCTLGMQDTGALPGMMKCAVGRKGLTPTVKKLLRVTAGVSAETGLPVFCHSVPELHQGPPILNLLEAQGVPARAVIIGHHGDTDDIGYLEAVLRRGCYLGLDRFGMVWENPATTAEKRAATLFALWRKGYGDQLLIGHDYAPYDGFSPAWQAYRANPGNDAPGYTCFGTVIVPLLKKMGMTGNDIRHLLADNPRRFFEEAYTG